VIAGLIGGVSLWLVALALPMLFGDWSWQLPGTDKVLIFGMENWQTWAFEALMVNIFLCARFFPYSAQWTKSSSPLPDCAWSTISISRTRVQLSHNSVEQMLVSLRRLLGNEADVEIEPSTAQTRS